MCHDTNKLQWVDQGRELRQLPYDTARDSLGSYKEKGKGGITATIAKYHSVVRVGCDIVPQRGKLDSRKRLTSMK